MKTNVAVFIILLTREQSEVSRTDLFEKLLILTTPGEVSNETYAVYLINAWFSSSSAAEL